MERLLPEMVERPPPTIRDDGQQLQIYVEVFGLTDVLLLRGEWCVGRS